MQPNFGYLNQLILLAYIEFYNSNCGRTIEILTSEYCMLFESRL